MATKRIPFHIVRLTLNIENGHHGFTTRHFHANVYTQRRARVNSRWAQYPRYRYYEDKRLVADVFMEHLKVDSRMSQTERRTLQDDELLDYMSKPTVYRKHDTLVATLLVPDGQFDADALYATLYDALGADMDASIERKKQAIRAAEQALKKTEATVAARRNVLHAVTKPALVHELTDKCHVELTEKIASEYLKPDGSSLVFYDSKHCERIYYDEAIVLLRYTSAAYDRTTDQLDEPVGRIRDILDRFHVPYPGSAMG